MGSVPSLWWLSRGTVSAAGTYAVEMLTQQDDDVVSAGAFGAANDSTRGNKGILYHFVHGGPSDLLFSNYA